MAKYGCCKDGKTAAEGSDNEGCDMIDNEGSGDIPCEDTHYGCCPDGITSKEQGCEEGPDAEISIYKVPTIGKLLSYTFVNIHYPQN